MRHSGVFLLHLELLRPSKPGCAGHSTNKKQRKGKTQFIIGPRFVRKILQSEKWKTKIKIASVNNDHPSEEKRIGNC